MGLTIMLFGIFLVCIFGALGILRVRTVFDLADTNPTSTETRNAVLVFALFMFATLSGVIFFLYGLIYTLIH